MAKKSADKGYLVDFGKMEGGGGRVRVPEGEYIAKVIGFNHDTAESSGNPMFVWDFEISEGKYEGKGPIRTRTILIPKSLWVLRNLLEAMGMKVPEKAVRIKKASVMGKEVGLSLQDEEYNNRTYSDVVDFVDPEVVRGNDVEDEDEEDLDEDSDEEEDEEDEDEDLDDIDLEDEL